MISTKPTRIEYTLCPLCESSNFENFLKADCTNHPLYNKLLPGIIEWNKCLKCNHIFTSGYFNKEANDIIFSSINDNQKFSHNIDIKNLQYKRLIASETIQRILPYKEHGTWLDVGFGDGVLLTTANEYGFKPIGIDIRLDTVSALKKIGVEAYALDISNTSIKGDCDVISLMDVLEHLPYPKMALENISKLLKPGGILLISMPNISSYIWHHMNKNNQNPYWGELEHYHNFSSERLYELLKQFNFKKVSYGISKRYLSCMEVIFIKI